MTAGVWLAIGIVVGLIVAGVAVYFWIRKAFDAFMF